jgi:uncharacterized membrane protein YeaQ/YmgE (transglycosylase-associated protein family)
VDLILYLIVLAAIGLVIGALARLALPGPDPMGVPATIGIGMAGALIAGLLGRLVVGRSLGFVVAVLISTLLVYLVRRSRGGSFTRAASPSGAGRGRYR